MNGAAPPRREWLAAALLALAWLGASAWLRPLMLPDEGRYAGVAWEMLRSGDWLTPTLDGLPFFHKPPLFYWVTAGAMQVFGLNEFAARAASLLAAAAAAGALFAFVNRWRDRRAAGIVLIVLLAQPLWTLGGQFANLDMLVAACISGTILLFAHAALCEQRALPYHRALAGAYAMAALGVLAKGLIGALLPALVIVSWLAMQRQRRTLRAMLWWPGGVLFVLIAAPWFVVMQMRHAEFFDYFFIVQHFKRFTSGGFNNVMPFWFYPAALALCTLPWWPWMRGMVRRGALHEAQQGDVRMLMWLWLGSIVLFFSLPASKLLGYVLPAVPPLAWLIADAYLRVDMASTRRQRLWWASAGVAGAVSMGAVIALTVQPQHSSRDIARALAKHRAPHETVYLLGRFDYDLPFYARLRAPIVVVDRWGDPDFVAHDNWRKELIDAGRFAPSAADQVLLQPEALASSLCAGTVSWVVGSTEMTGTHPFLTEAAEAARQRDTRLWMIDPAWPKLAAALGCAAREHGEAAH